jgi:uncharacterized membrane protein/thiol-disulfide isomerase/thioredoxin
MLALIVVLFAAPAIQSAAAQAPVVHAVLFFSPTCGHCEKVINEDLPPLVQQFKGQLDIVGIDVSQPKGMEIYQAALTAYNVPDDRIGVPTLIVGENYLVGSQEIPERLPGIVKAGLSAGGVDFPKIQGLAEVLAAQGIIQDTSTPSQAGGPGFVQKFLRDPFANTIAVIVLLGMVFILILTLVHFLQGVDRRMYDWPHWLVPVFALLGLFVAGYLSFIELTKTEALCGPLGDCNSVQSSPYAYLFGILPVGILGAVGYLSILAAWLIAEFGPQSLRKFAALAAWGMAWFGVLFSCYLTFLEPFVIGATCAWCISSAILITLVLWATTGPAIAAMRSDGDPDDDDDHDESEPEEAQEEPSEVEDTRPNQALSAP